MQGLPQVVTRNRQKTGFGEVREVELMGPLLDLAFERCIRILELPSHAVELIAQRLQFIAGVNADPLVEIAAADADGTIAQCADRYDHSTREIEAGECRQYESRDEQRAGTSNRAVERCIGLIHGQLDKDQPFEQLDWSMHAQHFPAFDVVDHQGLLGWRRGAFRARSLDLYEP